MPDPWLPIPAKIRSLIDRDGVEKVMKWVLEEFYLDAELFRDLMLNMAHHYREEFIKAHREIRDKQRK